MSSCISDIRIIFFLFNVSSPCFLEYFNAHNKIYFGMNVRAYEYVCHHILMRFAMTSIKLFYLILC